VVSVSRKARRPRNPNPAREPGEQDPVVSSKGAGGPGPGAGPAAAPPPPPPGPRPGRRPPAAPPGPSRGPPPEDAAQGRRPGDLPPPPGVPAGPLWNPGGDLGGRCGEVPDHRFPLFRVVGAAHVEGLRLPGRSRAHQGPVIHAEGVQVAEQLEHLVVRMGGRRPPAPAPILVDAPPPYLVRPPPDDEARSPVGASPLPNAPLPSSSRVGPDHILDGRGPSLGTDQGRYLRRVEDGIFLHFVPGPPVVRALPQIAHDLLPRAPAGR
jgi:hypothetical protein